MLASYAPSPSALLPLTAGLSRLEHARSRPDTAETAPEFIGFAPSRALMDNLG
jgi:hypothetical protein